MQVFHSLAELAQIAQRVFFMERMTPMRYASPKLVRPDDTLQDIAFSYREPEVRGGDPRQALLSLIMADRFRDLDHMHNYLQYGPDALDGLIRMSRDDRSVILPTSQINGPMQPGTAGQGGLCRVGLGQIRRRNLRRCPL